MTFFGNKQGNQISLALHYLQNLFRTIQRLYFSYKEEQIICSYNNNIYQLYKDLQEYDGDGETL